MTEAISLSSSPTVPHATPEIRQDVLDQLQPSDPQDSHFTWQEFDGPEVEPHRLLGILQGDDRALTDDVVVWECDDERWLGWGVAAELSAGRTEQNDAESAKIDRFDAVRQAAAATRISCASSTAQPRWFGGFEFDPRPQENRNAGAPGAARDVAAWHSFGVGVFVLPKIVVRRVRERTSWFLVLQPAEQALGPRSTAVQQLSWLWDQVEARIDGGPSLSVASPTTSTSKALSAAHPDRKDSGGMEPSAVDHSSESFAERIREVVDLISDGTAQKIVAADQTVVALSSSPRLDEVLSVWAERAPESTRFLFCRNGVAFLGATPERLVALEGMRVTTQALAGTEPKRLNSVNGDQPDVRRTGLQSIEQRLLESPKEQHEHSFVVHHIVSQLQPLCGVIQVHAQPRVLELHDLLHLQTPITANLNHRLHILQLVQQLHPTPAVCGLPSEVAANWICENEKANRGWYSGPVGWFEPSGEGDFFVALRSMLLSEEEASSSKVETASWSHARLFAGVGLVAGSEVDQEQREVATKLLTAGRTLDPWLPDQPARQWRERQPLEEDQ